MKKRKKTAKRQRSNTLLYCVRAALLACIASVLLVFVLALAVKQGIVTETAISKWNSVIKAVSACIAGVLCVGKFSKLSWVYSGISGVAYLLFAWFAFSLIEGTFSVSIKIVLDVLTCFVCAGASCTFLQMLKNIRTQHE